MLSIGMLGINHRTADLSLRETVAKAAAHLGSEKAIFFPHPIVLLSTCNRTEIYFSSEKLAEAHSDLLSHLRLKMDDTFEQHVYSFFGIDSFYHLCKVAAGLDSAMFAETEIQRQVRVAYANAKKLSSSLHYLFQKALKVSKEVRGLIQFQKKVPSLYAMMWKMGKWRGKKILLVGHSKINQGLISFLIHKKITDLTVCTRQKISIFHDDLRFCGRDILKSWQDFDIIVAASKSDEYLIKGKADKKHLLFDLSVPRNIDPNVGGKIYNIEEMGKVIQEMKHPFNIEECEDLIWEKVTHLSRIYRIKTQHARESAEKGSHLEYFQHR